MDTNDTPAAPVSEQHPEAAVEAAPVEQGDAVGVEQEGGHVFYPPTEATQPLDVNELHSKAPEA
jgi:hypothetical protein